MFESMLVITAYMLAILAPVRIPPIIHAAYVVTGQQRTSTRERGAATFPRRTAFPRLAVPAAAGLVLRTPRPGPHQQVRARSFRLQNPGAVPVAGQQREFHLEPVAADLAAARGRGNRTPPRPALSPEDRHASQVGWPATSLRRAGVGKFCDEPDDSILLGRINKCHNPFR